MSAIVDGLVFAYDMDNPKSWKGAPATNLVNQTNAYPDIGNSWGTYNTNQYNSNTYWEWGTSPSVSGNILTWGSVSRTVHQYDCIRPQTSGGGLTAGQDYTIRKINSTQFTIHVYNADQDGSEGYDVHNNCNNDTRVAISASGFPTMWWGAPHRPNAGLVKEIIPDGFKHRGRTHSCIRLNYDHRDAGGGLDGWAYGGSVPSSTGGATYTMSWYRRAVDEKAVGSDPGFSMYSGGGWSLTRTRAVPLSMDWERVVYRGTPPANAGTNFYWWPSGSNSYEVSEIMWTQTDYAPEFCVGTRSNTEALLDLTGNHTITANNLVYTDDNTFEFNGTNTYANVTGGPSFNMYCLDFWVYFNNAVPNNDSAIGGPSTYQTMITFNNAGTPGVNLGGWTSGASNEAIHIWSNSGGTSGYNGMTYNRTAVPVGWHNVVFNWNGSNYDIWVDGEKTTVYVGPNGHAKLQPITSFQLGRNNGSYYFNGKLPITKMYSRQLSDSEVKQNFNAVRSRYGI